MGSKAMPGMSPGHRPLSTRQQNFRPGLNRDIFMKTLIMQTTDLTKQGTVATTHRQVHGNDRQAYLDWLRILAILGVLLFHSAMAFVADWGWHIKNKETSNLLLEFNFWLHNFRMPLLFFISGTVSYFMLQKRTG